jgi:adenine deaminase
LVTGSSIEEATVIDGLVACNVERDILKLMVLNRYQPAKPALAFVRGFGLGRGALASSVAHDSHNIIAVGATDEELCFAVNKVVENSGGLSVARGNTVELLPLPVAGLMSTETCESVGANYMKLEQTAKEFGCRLNSPFMTVSFLALLVIPSLKLSDQGLFDVDRFEFVPQFV